VVQYTRGSRDAFFGEPVTQDAVLRRMETLADAAGRLSSELKARHPSIPWREIYGFRNVAAHAYLVIDLERVWETIELHLPALKAAVDEELERFPAP
jgi:uncharacterized protein with HEPN domain